MDFIRHVAFQLEKYLKSFPCVAILGPRQVGKTTTALGLKSKFGDDSVYLDLESDEDLTKLDNAEDYFKSRKDKLIIIDEIQRKPSLLPLLRSVIDRSRKNGRFLLLGSASPELLAQSSETLAGRIAYVEMHPLMFSEVKESVPFSSLWLKGGFPMPLLENDLELSLLMRRQFIQTYIERELPLLGLSASPVTLKNLLRMLAHYHGQIINYADLSKSLGIHINTVKRYIDYFENAFLIRRLQPWSTNSGKRLVKSPKVYIRDTGLLHCLFNIETQEDLDGFNAKGNSWEGFVIQDIIANLKPAVSPFFYRTQDGSELDLVLVKGNKPVIGVELKLSNSPSITKGTTISTDDLGGIPVLVVTPSASEDYVIREKITVTSFERIFLHLEKAGCIG